MEKYNNGYRSKLTNRVIDLLNKYTLVKNVYYHEDHINNLYVDCIEVDTSGFVNTEIYNKRFYIACHQYNDTFISCMRDLFPTQVFSRDVLYGLMRDARNLQQPNDDFGIVFIDGRLCVEAQFSIQPNTTEELISCMINTEEAAQLAIKRMDNHVNQRQSAEEMRLRYN